MSVQRSSAFALLLFLLLITSQLCPAKSSPPLSGNGTISGTIADGSGAPIANASVRATALEGGLVAEAKSSASGVFVMTSVAPGTYVVEISAPGVWKAVLDGVKVAEGSETRLGSVRLAAASAKIAAPQAPTEAATEAVPQDNPLVSGVELKQFPGLAENRGLDQLALLVPGVTEARDDDFSTANPVSFSANGLRSRSNDQQVDGQYNNDNTLGGPVVRFANPEPVQRYHAITLQPDSEYGRNSGSVVDVLTQAGTNAWHGSVYGVENNSVLNAMTNTQAFAGLTHPSHRNDEFAGATIGGPIVRDRWFLFGSFDQGIVSQETVFHSDSLTPTPAGLAMLFACFPVSQSLGVLTKFGPYAISGGNPQVSGTAVSGIVPGCAAAQFAGVNRTLPTPQHVYDFVVRTDVHLGANAFNARYMYQHQSDANLTFGDSAAQGYPVDLTQVGQGVQLGWTRTITPAMVNQARVGYTRFNLELGGNDLGTVPRVQNLDHGVAQIGFTERGLMGFGVPSYLPQSRTQNTWQAQDDWSYSIGKHQLKAGVDYLYQRTPSHYLADTNGVFRFADWSMYVGNLPDMVRVSAGDSAQDYREQDVALYFQDDWKLRSDLTVTLGLTWSYFSQPINQLHDETLAREQSGTPLWNPAVDIGLRTVPAVDAPLTNFGPNVGFAYSPQWGGFLTGNGKMVIRGGYRMLYDPPFYSLYRDVASSSPTSFRPITIAPASLAFPMPAVPTGPNVRAAWGPALAAGVNDPRRQTQYTLAPDFAPDRVQAWTFGIEREFTRNAVFEARYVGNRADNLYQSVNANPFLQHLSIAYPALVPAGVTPCVAPAIPEAFGRADCNRGIVNQRGNSGYSDYHALQLEFRANSLWDQLSLRTGYTWSKTTDNVSEILSTGAAGNTVAFLQDPLAGTASEHGLSGLDFPQRWTLSFVEELPFFKQQRGAMGHVFGGWGVAGDYTLASGQPYTPSQWFMPALAPDFYDEAFVSGFNDFRIARPFLGSLGAPDTTVGAFAGDACLVNSAACVAPPLQLISLNALNQSGAVVPVTSDAVRYILNGAAAQSVFGTPFGNVSRNAGRADMANLGNFSVYKNTKLSERVNFQFRVTFLNAFNHPNYGSIDPFLEDAGLQLFRRGFAAPSVMPGSARSIFFGGRITF